jgi:L-amino acid N-acyltransferase YncA
MIRIAKKEDLESIVEIHNQAVDAGFQTAFTNKSTAAEKEGWFNAHPEDKYPIFVFEQDGKVTGYLYISPYRENRVALQYVVEVSYFIHNQYHRMGIGSQLLEQGINKCRKLDYKTMLAIIMEPNRASAKMLEKSGFEKWGYLPDIADYNGVQCSQVYYGMKL